MDSALEHKKEVYRLLAEHPEIDLTPAMTSDGIYWTIGVEDIGFMFNESVELDNWKMVLLYVRACIAALKAYQEADAQLYPPTNTRIEQASL